MELQGKYNTAKVFTDVVDEASIAQITVAVEKVTRPVYNFKAGEK